MTPANLWTSGLILSCTIAATANALPSAAVEQLLVQYQTEGAEHFSAKRGFALWQSDHQGRSCSSCHTESPTAQGQHQKTKKPIAALAPSANSKRLQQAKSIRKWLKRNCKWTLGRECSAQEKGDFLTWLSQQ